MAVEHVRCRSWGAGQRIEDLWRQDEVEANGRWRAGGLDRAFLRALDGMPGGPRACRPRARCIEPSWALGVGLSPFFIDRSRRLEQCSDTSGIEAKLDVPVHAQTEVNNEVKHSAR